MFAVAVFTVFVGASAAVWPYSCAAGMNVSDFNNSMHGKTVLLTGSDGRLGSPLSVALLQSGATLIAGSRTIAKANANKAKLEAQLGPGHTVDTMVADLSSFDSVRAGAAVVLAKHDTIDVVINMAGGHGFEFITDDGFDGTMEINHLSSALLTELLLPALHKSAQPRVVYLGSANMYDQVVEWDQNSVVQQATAQLRNASTTTRVDYRMFHYSLAKLFVVNYAAEQARRHPELTVFTVNPGVGRSDAWNHTKYASYCTPGVFDSILFRPCPQYPEQAVSSTFFAATQPGIEAASGALLDFATNITKEMGAVQSGETCIPRPLPQGPSYAITSHRSDWYDVVHSIVEQEELLV